MNTPGDVLVFMPGRGEINATLDALRSLRTPRAGGSAYHVARRAGTAGAGPGIFAPNALRKVIVATNVAETSITIDGIRHVVDSGAARIARYDAERGIGTLVIGAYQPCQRGPAERPCGPHRTGDLPPALDCLSVTKSREERNTPGNPAQRPRGSCVIAALAWHPGSRRI